MYVCQQTGFGFGGNNLDISLEFGRVVVICPCCEQKHELRRMENGGNGFSDKLVGVKVSDLVLFQAPANPSCDQRSED